jgi:hypothetical protein
MECFSLNVAFIFFWKNSKSSLSGIYSKKCEYPYMKQSCLSLRFLLVSCLAFAFALKMETCSFEASVGFCWIIKHVPADRRFLVVLIIEYLYCGQ